MRLPAIFAGLFCSIQVDPFFHLHPTQQGCSLSSRIELGAMDWGAFDPVLPSLEESCKTRDAKGHQDCKKDPADDLDRKHQIDERLQWNDHFPFLLSPSSCCSLQVWGKRSFRAVPSAFAMNS